MNLAINKMNRVVDKILSYENKMRNLTDDELRNKTNEFKDRLQLKESLDSLLPEAFAVVREASKRVLGLEHFRVQLLGGIALHKGYIAEMKTGEGKTLVSTCPAYLNALTGKSVYIVTVNDYLAKRDAELMGQVHRFLGLSVGVVLNEMNTETRKFEYGCDITYVTNNELGFDYLRDNMALSEEQQVLRGLNYCIIDEIDSVLIDEARTPLIISGQSERSTSLYFAADYLAKRMVKGESQQYSKSDFLSGKEIEETGDFILDEKDKIVHLTSKGNHRVEEFFHISNLAEPDNIDIQHHIHLALKANYLMHRNKDYVVKEDEILIVDEFTGRTMPGRRYSDGLHQAIEAKEDTDIKKESKTMATITFQSFFNKFEKKSGMTGTAKTEEKEFKSTYHMHVLEIPTNRPVIRKDHDDLVFKTKKEKFHAVIDEIEQAYEKGQPVLVGTITIRTSELLSKMLNKRNIPHNVLNAKNAEAEALIVEEAGKHKAVTIATNMAGRGTDIKLDDEARALGGLKVIGTEKHESRRIDNQLRGRAGRQGDPGESCFYISLEDDLLKHFGSEKMKEVFGKSGVEDGEAIYHKLLTKTIENAQKKLENNNYGIREQLLKYDVTNNEQRELIYKERNDLLKQLDVGDTIIHMIKDCVSALVVNYDKVSKDEKASILNKISMIIPIQINTEEYLKLKKKVLLVKLHKQIESFYRKFENNFQTIDEKRELERGILLKIIDINWMNHLNDMDKLKEGITLQAYAQHDPVIEYKIEAYKKFEEMINNIKKMTVEAICIR
jgi:preprotein translocase subunit SecA